MTNEVFVARGDREVKKVFRRSPRTAVHSLSSRTETETRASSLPDGFVGFVSGEVQRSLGEVYRYPPLHSQPRKCGFGLYGRPRARSLTQTTVLRVCEH